MGAESSRQGQGQTKLGTTRDAVVGADAAAHAAGQRFAQAQAQTQCARSGGEEGLENLRHHIIGDARAGILDAELGGVLLGAG